ncbi:DUF4349 domain-containing protein [Acinetobacter equi]|uniref:DUF4349 domain-containing protein n=1 Tax=Acinetobacter equi TaxID=1324350 RepID=A0A0N9VFF9_9GAMM|nr:DUF4349 domain-containing protein [Acinetobacter equi]ALH96048.1 hypothetical protein AOY20_11180 [Acinetobacter equi]
MKIKSKVLVLCLSSFLLISCSKKEVANELDYNEPSVDTSQIVAEEPTVQQSSNEPTKPDYILSTDVSLEEKARRMVREASVQFIANDVVKTALAIDKMTFEAGGFVEKKNIDFHVLDVKSQSIADGKIKIFEKVNPVAMITVRIPSEKAAVFVNQLLPLMTFLNQQQYKAKRYELQLLEEKISQSQTIPSNTKNLQLSEIARLTQMEVQDRVRFSTINIYISQPAMIRERIDVDVDAVARLNGDQFFTRAWSGIQSGWQFILDLLVILLTIWPLYIAMFIAYFAFKFLNKLFKKLN